MDTILESNRLSKALLFPSSLEWLGEELCAGSAVWCLTLSLYLFLISVRLGPAHRHEKGAQQAKMQQFWQNSPLPRMRTLRPYCTHGHRQAMQHTPRPPPKQLNRPSAQRGKKEAESTGEQQQQKSTDE